MNPLKYNENDVNKMTKFLAKDVWKYDNYKYELAVNNGYKVKIIWEYDYRNNKEEIIKECLNFFML